MYLDGGRKIFWLNFGLIITWWIGFFSIKSLYFGVFWSILKRNFYLYRQLYIDFNIISVFVSHEVSKNRVQKRTYACTCLLRISEYNTYENVLKSVVTQPAFQDCNNLLIWPANCHFMPVEKREISVVEKQIVELSILPKWYQKRLKTQK